MPCIRVFQLPFPEIFLLRRTRAVPVTPLESVLDFASAKLFECDFSIKLPAILGVGFSSVLRTPSRQLSVWSFLYETAIDDKIFVRHPPCRESFLEALPNCAAREPR